MTFIWPWVTSLLLCISIVGCVTNSTSANQSATEVARNEEKTGTIESHDGPNNRTQTSIVRKFSHSNSKVFNPNNTAAEFLADMNLTAKPCDNFYEYVCGNYKPGGYLPLHRRDYFHSQASSHMEDILAEVSLPDEIQPLKNVRNFYQACMNTTKTSIENDLHTFKEILSELGGWPMFEGSKWQTDKFNWSDLIVKLGAINSNVFFSSGCSSYSKCWILPAESMFNHDELTDPPYRNHDETVNAYYDRVKAVLAKMGGDSEAIRVQFFWDVLRFDKEIFELSKRFPRPIAYSINTMMYSIPMEDLISRYPEIPFFEHFSAVTRFTLPQVSVRKDFLVDTISDFLSELIVLMKFTSRKTLANYAMLRLAVTKTPASSLEILNIKPSVYANNVRRSYHCFTKIEASLPLAKDVLYVRSYFPAYAQDKAADMIADIRAQTKIYLNKIHSLNTTTIQRMLTTVEKMNVAFGYPNEFFDDDQIKQYYEGLVIPKDDFIQGYFELCLYNIRSFKHSESLDLYKNWKKYTKNWDRLSYAEYPQDIQVPAGFLHGSFFHVDQPNYLNYAGAGQYIGTALGILSSVHEGYSIKEMDDLIKRKIHKLSCQRFQTGQTIFNESRSFKNFDSYPKTVYYQRLGMNIAFAAYKSWLSRNNRTELQLPEMNYTVEQMFWINVMHQECSQKYDSTSWIFYITELVNVMSSRGFLDAFGCPNVLQNPICPKVG